MMDTMTHLDTPSGCGLKGGDLDCEDPPLACEGFSPRAELSSPSTDDHPYSRDVGFNLT